ncbi:Histidine protein methyltransferase 1-like, partial [Homarus americanus]
MFKFNFNLETEEQNDSPAVASESELNSQCWIPAQKHEVLPTHLQSLSEDTVIEAVTIDQTEIKYLNMNSAVERLKKLRVSTNLSTALTDHSDLVPAVYEGGLKVWECTWDLLHYFAASGIKMKGCRVLEVGCGAALPALYAAIHGAHITLQDYKQNSEQLTNDDQTSRNKDESQEYKFDIILTSETIYNPNCHEKLLNLMTNSLKQDAKSHYFGVGGGTLQFIDLVKCQDILNIQTTVTNTE